VCAQVSVLCHPVKVDWQTTLPCSPTKNLQTKFINQTDPVTDEAKIIL
jgi:hypothetical protein